MISIEQFVGELQKSIGLFMPETALVVTFLVAILADLFFRKTKIVGGITALLGFAVTAIFLMQQTGMQDQAFSRMIVIDSFGQAFKFIILATSAIIVIFSFFSKELYNDGIKSLGEYYSLIVGMTLGMFLLSASTNLIMIYLAIETMSISSYILSGYTKEIRRSSEASLKYVIFGAVSSGIMIYGISILFGLTGTLNLFEINNYLSANSVSLVPLTIAGIMIIAGIAYKISAVPFHFWTPDVYEGSPITITAYLSVASKAAGFAILMRFIKVSFIDADSSSQIWVLLSGVDWKFIIAILSVLTMTIGNLVAIWQTNMKRLLAYSSIAHAGYLLMGVVVMNDTGVAAILVYFVAYLVMNLGAFFVVMLIANKIGSEDIEDYNGLAYRNASLCVAMVVFLISLTGLPPTIGFIGKLTIFAAVVKDPNFLWLAVIGVLNSVVSLFYYVKVIRNMFIRGSEKPLEKLTYSPASLALVFIFAIPVIIFGIYYTPLVNWANSSVSMFIGK